MKKRLTAEGKKEIDRKFQNEKGCGKSLLKTKSYVLCGDATYGQNGGLNKVTAFCNSCRNKFVNHAVDDGGKN